MTWHFKPLRNELPLVAVKPWAERLNRDGRQW